MNPIVIYFTTAVLVCGIGLAGVFFGSELLRRILAVNIAGSGVFMILVTIARRQPDVPPDPVPHALVLTGIVVAVSATAVALALLRKLAEHSSDD